MIKDREVSLGWTCYSYSLKIKQSFLVKISRLSSYLTDTMA